MFPNLEAEMARSKITRAKLAEILGITPTTLSLKMSGKGTLSLKECVAIKKMYFQIRHWTICLKQKQIKNHNIL